MYFLLSSQKKLTRQKYLYTYKLFLIRLIGLQQFCGKKEPSLILVSEHLKLYNYIGDKNVDDCNNSIVLLNYCEHC